MTCHHLVNDVATIHQVVTRHHHLVTLGVCLHAKICDWNLKRRLSLNMPKKYDDFVESDPVERRGKLPPYAPVNYIDITCPHCKVVFAEIGKDLLASKKSTVCLQHLRVCKTFTDNGGSVTQKKASSTEFEELKAKVQKMEELQAKVEEQGVTIQKQGSTIQDLQDKTGLYDTVLMAVMPSLALPLTAPEERAQLSLREAAMKDLPLQPLALLPPSDVVPLSTHIQMIEEKNTTIEEKNTTIEQKDKILELYQRQVDAKESELALTLQNKKQVEQEKNQAEHEKIQAEIKKNDADLRSHEATLKMNSLASRMNRLQKERDDLKKKCNELINKIPIKPSQILQNQLEEAHRQGEKRYREG